MTTTAAPAATQTLYFTARNGKVMSWDDSADRREAQMYVNRNNAAAARRGDASKPYHLLTYTVPAN
jgi:hypothetical protein